MNLNYAFVFLVIFIGAFAVIYESMPTDFFIADYNIDVQEAYQIRDQFESLDMAIYSSFGNDSMTKGYTSITDGPDAPDWETDIPTRFIEIWWDDYTIPDVGGIGLAFQVRDTEEREIPILGTKYYVNLELTDLTLEGVFVGPFILRSSLLDVGSQQNATVVASGDFISASILLIANDTLTLLESWDAEVLGYSVTYEIDFSAMKPNAFLLIGQLITFQNPDFGVPGLFGELLSYFIGIAFWAVIALIAYTLVTKLLPTIQGGLEG